MTTLSVEHVQTLLATIDAERRDIRIRISLLPDWQRLTFLDGAAEVLTQILAPVEAEPDTSQDEA